MNIRFLLLFLLYTSNLSAQDISFPDSGAVWVNTYDELEDGWGYTPPTSYTSFVSTGEYITIGGEEFFKVYFGNGTYKGAIQDSVGFIFYVPDGGVEKKLLYNFNAVEGDTLYNIYFESYSGSPMLHDYLVVQTVDSVLIGPNYHKRIEFVSGSQWIEGVGNTHGLFKESLWNVSMYWLNLECMSLNEKVLCESGTNFPYSDGLCLWHMDTPEVENIQLNLYPNPAGNVLHCEFENSRERKIRILGINGNIVFQSIENNALIELNISDFESGIYVLEVEEKDRILRKKFIKSN